MNLKNPNNGHALADTTNHERIQLFVKFFHIKGFSLLELLVVLLIISLTAGLVFGINFRHKESVTIRAFVSELSQFMRTARSYALLDSQENICVYNRDDQEIFEVLRAKSIKVPEEIALIFDGVVNEGKSEVAAFFPDGSVIVENFAIESFTHRYFPEVEPFMGRVEFRRKQ